MDILFYFLKCQLKIKNNTCFSLASILKFVNEFRRYKIKKKTSLVIKFVEQEIYVCEYEIHVCDVVNEYWVHYTMLILLGAQTQLDYHTSIQFLFSKTRPLRINHPFFLKSHTPPPCLNWLKIKSRVEGIQNFLW